MNDFAQRLVLAQGQKKKTTTTTEKGLMTSTFGDFFLFPQASTSTWNRREPQLVKQQT